MFATNLDVVFDPAEDGAKNNFLRGNVKFVVEDKFDDLIRRKDILKRTFLAFSLIAT